MKIIFYLTLLLLIASASCKKSSPNSFQYSLTSPVKGWYTDSFPTYAFEFEQGHYLVRLSTPANLVYALVPNAKLTTPYTVQVEGTTQLQDTTGGKQAATDLIFNHVDDSDYSRVEVWSGGYYRILTKANGVFDTVANFTAYAGIVTGNNNTNTVTVVQNASNMQLMINGAAVNTFPITLPPSSVDVGLGITTGDVTYTPAVDLYNNFTLTKN